MNKKALTAIVAAGSWIGGMTAADKADKLFKSTCSRTAAWQYGGSKGGGTAVPIDKYGDAPQAGRKWIDDVKKDDVWIESSHDEAMLFANYIPCEEAKRIILCVHGYRGSIYDFSGSAKWLHDNGSELLLINQRGTGLSGGEWITFGALEQYDVLDWLRYLHDRNYGKLPIYMYGISLGATTVMCASGHDLPDDVAGMIADCGFSSMESIVTDLSGKWYGIPSAPILAITARKCRSQAGFDMKEADAERNLSHCRIPSLFIHGTDDHFVIPENSKADYEACASSDKELLMIDGAKHGVSCYEDPDSYFDAIYRLFERCESI